MNELRIHLIVRNRGQAGKRIRVAGPFFLIGRSEACSLRTGSHSVSLRHCVIVQKNGRAYVKDLDSRNGTYLNETKMGSGQALRLFDRDKLNVGKLSLRLSIKHALTRRPVAMSNDERTSQTSIFLTKSKLRSIKPDSPPDNEDDEI